jgi:acyl dehydratase
MPKTSETFVTRPSLTPKTAARAPPPRTSRWWWTCGASCSGDALTAASVVRCPHAGSVPPRNRTLTSEEHPMKTTVDGVDAFHEFVGKELGHSEWQTITQERVNLFADATDDHQWIHVDPERAKDGPFGTAIAHGYLTLSLAPVLLNQVIQVDNMKFGVNYGCNKVRFPSPVPVGSDLRMGVTVAQVDDTEGGVQVTYDLVMEIRDAPKPACVAQVVYRYYR